MTERDREQRGPLDVDPDETRTPQAPIVKNEPDLVTGMGGGDDPIVEGVEVETDLEERAWPEPANDQTIGDQ